MRLYFQKNGIKNKTGAVNAQQWNGVIQHCLSQPAVARYKPLFKQASEEGQYLRNAINVMLVGFVGLKRRAAEVGAGVKREGEERRGVGTGVGEGEEKEEVDTNMKEEKEEEEKEEEEEEEEGEGDEEEDEDKDKEEEDISAEQPRASPKVALVLGVSEWALGENSEVVGQYSSC